MLEKLHRGTGTAGLVVAIVALVAALGGGAYAASGGLTGKQKKEVKSIAKQFAGKSGAVGPAGAKGDPGAGGDQGTPGLAGKSVVLSAAGSECAAGGTKIEVEGSGQSRSVCNGEAGEGGSSSGTLPVGQTETGAWSFTGAEQDAIGVPVSISFNIPLAAALEAEKTIYIPSGGPNPDPTDCPGTPNEPAAASGFLCVYAGFTEGVALSGIIQPGSAPGAAPAGALILFEKPTKNGAVGFGSWAVTG